MRLKCWRGVVPLVLLFHVLDGFGADDGFRVLNAELVPVDEQYVLNAEVDYHFSEPVGDALQHGVPLTLVLHLRIERPRDYWPDATVLDETRCLRIRYHPLDKSFQLFRDNSEVPQTFASLATLLDVIGIVRGWRVLPVARLEAGREYQARFAVDLDIEALPLPLRPVAYASPGWYLGSPWFRWRVAR